MTRSERASALKSVTSLLPGKSTADCGQVARRLTVAKRTRQICLVSMALTVRPAIGARRAQTIEACGFVKVDQEHARALKCEARLQSQHRSSTCRTPLWKMQNVQNHQCLKSRFVEMWIWVKCKRAIKCYRIRSRRQVRSFLTWASPQTSKYASTQTRRSGVLQITNAQTQCWYLCNSTESCCT